MEIGQALGQSPKENEVNKKNLGAKSLAYSSLRRTPICLQKMSRVRFDDSKPLFSTFENGLIDFSKITTNSLREIEERIVSFIKEQARKIIENDPANLVKNIEQNISELNFESLKQNRNESIEKIFKPFLKIRRIFQDFIGFYSGIQAVFENDKEKMIVANSLADKLYGEYKKLTTNKDFFENIPLLVLYGGEEFYENNEYKDLSNYIVSNFEVQRTVSTNIKGEWKVITTNPYYAKQKHEEMAGLTDELRYFPDTPNCKFMKEGVRDLFALREEIANSLGYTNYAEYRSYGAESRKKILQEEIKKLEKKMNLNFLSKLKSVFFSPSVSKGHATKINFDSALLALHRFVESKFGLEFQELNDEKYGLPKNIRAFEVKNSGQIAGFNLLYRPEETNEGACCVDLVKGVKEDGCLHRKTSLLTVLPAKTRQNSENDKVDVDGLVSLFHEYGHVLEKFLIQDTTAISSPDYSDGSLEFASLFFENFLKDRVTFENIFDNILSPCEIDAMHKEILDYKKKVQLASLYASLVDLKINSEKLFLDKYIKSFCSILFGGQFFEYHQYAGRLFSYPFSNIIAEKIFDKINENPMNWRKVKECIFEPGYNKPLSERLRDFWDGDLPFSVGMLTC